MRSEKKTVILTEGAIMVALAVVLNFLRFDLGPEGGSVSLIFLPITVYALRRGPLWGIGAGLVFGMIKCLLGGGVAYGWQSIILDYAVAFAMLGLAGLFPKHPVLGSAVGALGALCSFVLSGVFVWGEYMPEAFFGLPMVNIWIYSLLYNGSFVLCNAILCGCAVALLRKKTKLLKK